MVQVSATRCSCIAILWISLVSFATITLCVASRVFIVVSTYFIINSVQKLLDTPSCIYFTFPLFLRFLVITSHTYTVLCRFANEMVYVGLSYYGPVLGPDQYMSFLLSSLVEIPSYLLCWIVMDRWGRRWPLCVCMILSGVSCIVTVLLSDG